MSTNLGRVFVDHSANSCQSLSSLRGEKSELRPTIKKQRISPLLLSGLYPPPGTLPNLTLLERGLGSGASGERSGAVAHHSIRDRAEGAYARSVGSDRRRHSLVGGGRSAGYANNREGVAALGARCQLRIDQASASRSWRCAAGASENA